MRDLAHHIPTKREWRTVRFLWSIRRAILLTVGGIAIATYVAYRTSYDLYIGLVSSLVAGAVWTPAVVLVVHRILRYREREVWRPATGYVYAALIQISDYILRDLLPAEYDEGKTAILHFGQTIATVSTKPELDSDFCLGLIPTMEEAIAEADRLGRTRKMTETLALGREQVDKAFQQHSYLLDAALTAKVLEVNQALGDATSALQKDIPQTKEDRELRVLRVIAAILASLDLWWGLCGRSDGREYFPRGR